MNLFRSWSQAGLELTVQLWVTSILFLFLRQSLLCGPNWPGTPYGEQTGLEFTGMSLHLPSKFGV